MGRKSVKHTELKCPRGVEVRQWPKGKTNLRIFFRNHSACLIN